MTKLMAAISLVILVVALGAFIGPDYAYLGTYYSLALAFGSLAYLLWPAFEVPLARGTFFIAICACGLVSYLALHVTMGRPTWWIEDYPFLVFLAFAGGMVAAVSYLIVSIGYIHRRTPLYVSATSAIIAFSFGLSWYIAPH